VILRELWQFLQVNFAWLMSGGFLDKQGHVLKETDWLTFGFPWVSEILLG
jgi:hypothetical protein